MRQILAALLTVLLFLPAGADTASWCRAQRRLARQQTAGGKAAEAFETLSLALAGARRERLHREAALVLADLAATRELAEADAAADGKDMPRLAVQIYAEAIREARAAGDRALETRLQEALSRAVEDEDEHEAAVRAALDAAISARDFDWLGAQVFFEEDVDIAFRVMDVEAEAALAQKRGDAKGAAARLEAMAADAEKAKLPLTAADLRVLAANTGADPAGAVRSLAAAIAAYDSRGDWRGLSEANLALGRARLASGDAGGSNRALQAALLAAREIRDPDLETRILFALADASDPARRPERLAEAMRAEERRHASVLRAAEEAAADPDIESEIESVAALRAERTRRPSDAAEVDRLLAVFGAGTPARVELKDPARDRLKTLLMGVDTLKTVMCLEVLGRTEAFAVAAETVAGSRVPGYVSLAIESLATHDDLPKLLTLLKETRGDADVAAAAAIFRLSTPADIPSIRKALGDKLSPGAAAWLQGVLAREGDAAALAALLKLRSEKAPVAALNSLAVLAQLGYGTPFKAFATLPEDYCEGWFIHLVLARAPETWGAELRWKNTKTAIDRMYAARGAFHRRDHSRVEALSEEREALSVAYELPRTPAERGICGMGWILRARSYMDGEGTELLWATEGSGMAFGDGEEKLKARKGNPLAEFAADDLEFHRFGRLAGAQTRILTVDEGEAWATCLATAVPECGEIVNDSLRLPFRLRWKTEEGDNGSLAGRIGHVSLAITLSSLVRRAEIRIPGFEPIEAAVGAGTDDRLLITAPLPHVKTGEGLGSDTLIPMETLEKGTVTLRLEVDKAKAAMTFPLAFVMPPKKDKPDLVAAELILEPAVPKPGEETRVILRARNIGKAVDKEPVISVRYAVRNPQAAEGRRTVSVILDGAGGWRPGEWREFEARPKVVRDWYMNRYALSWTLEMGDTRLSATIDADNAVEEDKEDNNVCEREVPLYVPDDEGKRLAVDEMLAELDKLMKKVEEAKTPGDARITIGLMKTVLGRSRVSGPEIDIARLHLEAAVQIQVERLRVRAALRQARELAGDPAANQEALKTVVAELVAAEADLLDSGVPVTGDSITYVRNRTQLAANLLGAAGEGGTLAGIARGTETEGAERLKEVGETINRLDGALQLIRYARDRVEHRQADAGDAIEGMVSIAGGSPGMSKLHQAMLQAELEYVDKGFRKEADALEALSQLIGGDKSAQERLDAACKDVEAHVTAGPFNKDSIRNIALGGVKDLPVLGKVVDAIVSWK